MSAVLKQAMRRAWPRPNITAAIYHDFVRDEHAVDGVRQALDQIWTFDRDSIVNGWERESRANLLTSFAVDEPAFVIDPATGKALGYRALAGFTNSLLDNRDLSTGNWIGSSIASADAVGLDGQANSAHTLTDSDAGGASNIRQTITVSDDSVTHTVSFPIKKDSDESRFPILELEFTGGTTALDYVCYLNTSTGAFQSSGDASSSNITVEDGGDWWLVSIVGANNGTGNTTLIYKVFPAAGNALESFSASTTGSIVYDFGGVYLNSSIAGPAIATEGSPVSTAADDASEPLPASCQDGFVWVVHGRVDVLQQSGLRYLGEVHDGSSTNRIALIVDSNADVEMFVADSSGALVSLVSFGTITPGQGFRVAFKAQDGLYTASIDGGSPVSRSPSGFPENLLTKTLGKSRTGEHLNGTIAHDELHSDPENWTDADLQAASTL